MLPARLIGKNRLRLGDLASITNVAKRIRNRYMAYSQDRKGIAGFPSHWLGAVDPSGLFSSPRNNVVDVVIEGSAAHAGSPEFDVREELKKSGFGQFEDSMKVHWFEGVRAQIHFSRFRDEDGPAPNLPQLFRMLSVRSVIRDGTIQRICVQDGIDGPMFLWAMFPRRKILSTGRYDSWGQAIDDYNHEILKRHRKVASLDLVAFSAEEDWLFSRELIDAAITDAYNSLAYKPALLELVRGTGAFHLLHKRTEPAAPMLSPVLIEPLFA